MSYTQRVKRLVAERDRQMAEISRLRDDRSAESSNLTKAHTLLTRFWSRASWSAREEIIQTSAWLLKLDQMAAGLKPAGPQTSNEAE